MNNVNEMYDVIAAAGDRVVVEDGTRQFTGHQLTQAACAVAKQLESINCRRVALHADNGINWIVADLASQLCGCLIVPIPLFFSIKQVTHVLRSSGCEALITDNCVVVDELANNAASIQLTVVIAISLMDEFTLYPLVQNSTPQIPARTDKITFTSGTTGTPKGVCLSQAHQYQVARSLACAIGIDRPRHLCVLPLGTLLENLAGVYAPLLSGGTVIVPPLANLGLHGSSGIEAQLLFQKISQVQPDTMILVPELLNVLIRGIEHGWQPPDSLQFVAVGGGRVSTSSLEQARKHGLPVYQGYGLSECGSVVSLNLPDADRNGSVGMPLSHVEISAPNGEIIVSGSQFLGYLDEPESWSAKAIHTGDLGKIDNDGFVFISGRIKHQMISSFGRNISPEWVESELLAGPLLQQAIVVGDAMPYCSALVYPGDQQVSDDSIAKWIDLVNQTLPDYARIRGWRRLHSPLTSTNGLLTENGRLRRAQIHAHFAHTISALYEQPSEVVNL